MHTYATTYEMKKEAFKSSRNISLKGTFIYQNMTVILAIYASNLNPCYDGNVHTYTTTLTLKKNAFRINSQNLKQIIGIQVTFIIEMKV